MTEFKFRVWDKVDYMSSPFTLQDLQTKKVEFTSDCPLMQFTGQLDREGKEIYEGDIVRHGESIRFVHQDGSRWLATRPNKTETILLSFTNPTIIGNIYQNADLLK